MVKADTLSEFDRLWSLATCQPIHGAFCTCAGGGGFVFTSSDLEQHLIDFLEEKYRWKTASKKLRADSVRRAENFLQKLERILREEGLGRELIDAAQGDVVEACRSIADASGGFSCR